MWSPSFGWLILGVLIVKLMQQHSPASSFKDCAQGRLHLIPAHPSSPLTYNCIKINDQVSAKLRDEGSNAGSRLEAESDTGSSNAGGRLEAESAEGSKQEEDASRCRISGKANLSKAKPKLLPEQSGSFAGIVRRLPDYQQR